ncbi:BTAD domain-containing putative transcriptional regulator [Actinoallomurus acanthiterrae]
MAETRLWLADDPVHEPFWARLMLALYQVGRAGQAVQTYTDAHQTIHRALGMDPDRNLVRIRDLIATGHNPVFGLRPPWSPPPHTAQQTMDSTRGSLAQLPPDLPDFTGLREPLDRLLAILPGSDASNRGTVAWVTGPPGAGKTSMAIHAAHELLHRGYYPDGQLYVHLAGSSSAPLTPGAILHQILSALGTTAGDIPDDLGARVAQYRSEMTGRRILLVADDAATASQIQPLIPESPGSSLLVTSRIKPTGQPQCHAINVSGFADDDARELLTKILGDEGQARINAELQATTDLVAECAGLPLAVRIAGARLATARNWSLRHMVNLLRAQGRRLDELSAGDLAVRTVIESSYQALDARSQVAFRRLSLFGPADFAPWTLTPLLNESDTEDVIDTLVQHSLVSHVGCDPMGQPRYQLHSLLNDFAAERLRQDADREAVLVRLLIAWLEILDRADSHLPREPYFPRPERFDSADMTLPVDIHHMVDADPKSWLTVEQANVLGMIRTAGLEGRSTLAMGLGMRLAAHLHIQAQHDEAQRMWQTIIDGSKKHGNDRVAGLARLRLATVIAADRWDFRHAISHLNACISDLRGDRAGVGNPRELSRALALRARCHLNLETNSAAEEDADLGLQIAMRVADRHAEFTCLGVLGLIAAGRGEHEHAIELCERGYAIAASLNEQSYISMALLALVNVHLLSGNNDTAAYLCDDGVRLAEQMDYGVGVAYFLKHQAEALRELARNLESIPKLERALNIFITHRIGWQVTNCRFSLAMAYRATGNSTQARAELGRCAVEFRNLNMPEDADRAEALAATLPPVADRGDRL